MCTMLILYAFLLGLSSTALASTGRCQTTYVNWKATKAGGVNLSGWLSIVEPELQRRAR